jgi:hypothetical protein
LRDALFWEHEGNAAVREGDWKLVRKGAEGAWELYDLKADRTELHDLAAAQPERAKKMLAKWEAWAKRTHVLPSSKEGAKGKGRNKGENRQKQGVIEAGGTKPLEAATAPPARLISQSPVAAKYSIAIDYTEAPGLKDWVEKKLQPTADTWYAKIIEALPSKNYTAPATVSIVITEGYRGVAATSGNHVVCSAAWFKRNSNGESPGAVVHELVHVVQQYRRAKGAAPNPGWLAEGLADCFGAVAGDGDSLPVAVIPRVRLNASFFARSAARLPVGDGPGPLGPKTSSMRTIGSTML